MGSESNVLLLKNKYRNKKSDRIDENQKFLKYEKENHQGSEIKTLVCLKNCLFPSVYNTVHEDNNPGLVRKYLPWVETVSEKLEADNLRWLRWLVVKVRRISTCYVDVFKDSALTFSIIVLIGGPQSLLLFPTKMTSVVVFSLLFSIFVPMFLSSIILAIDIINQSTHGLKLTEKLWIVMKCLLFTFINPLLLMNQVENLKEELISLCRTDTMQGTENDKKILDTKEKIDKIEQKNAAFLKTEFQIETLQQITIQSKSKRRNRQISSKPTLP